MRNFLFMKEEIKNVLQIEQQPAEQKNYRNGYYERTLDTRYGRIDDLMVPRDRNNEFQTQLFELLGPYFLVHWLPLFQYLGSV